MTLLVLAIAPPLVDQASAKITTSERTSCDRPGNEPTQGGSYPGELGTQGQSTEETCVSATNSAECLVPGQTTCDIIAEVVVADFWDINIVMHFLFNIYKISHSFVAIS